jgi:S-adenosylmethionine hydrolase
MAWITLTTDFSHRGWYVAEMKGVALQICPDVQLVDITHDVPPQQIRYGAFVLRQAVSAFPPQTIHVAVVDPGVGTQRRILCFRCAEQWLIGPDNGLLTWAVQRLAARDLCCRVVANRQLFRPVVSRTFHGRDIMVPVAAHLARGLPWEEVGPVTDHWEVLPWPEPGVEEQAVKGEVLVADPFGNLITNIPGSLLHRWRDRRLEASLGRWDRIPIVSTYGDAAPGTLVALEGSSGLLEVAVVNGNAAALTGCGAGAAVMVRTAPKTCGSALGG